MRFVFESNTREKKRQERLQKLDCSSLKFCGLSYTVREIIELPTTMFDFLVDNVADYVQSKQLSLLLCRDDINKVVLGDFDPEDEELFKCFVTCMSTFNVNSASLICGSTNWATPQWAQTSKRFAANHCYRYGRPWKSNRYTNTRVPGYACPKACSRRTTLYTRRTWETWVKFPKCNINRW